MEISTPGCTKSKIKENKNTKIFFMKDSISSLGLKSAYRISTKKVLLLEEMYSKIKTICLYFEIYFKDRSKDWFSLRMSSFEKSNFFQNFFDELYRNYIQPDYRLYVVSV